MSRFLDNTVFIIVYTEHFVSFSSNGQLSKTDTILTGRKCIESMIWNVADIKYGAMLKLLISGSKIVLVVFLF